jgi:tetraacyldisaccharide 4'-kinase
VVSSLYRQAYEILIPKTRLSIPVISVGNIVAGGCGKTPLVYYLAKVLAPKKIAILSRGYKRSGKDPFVVELDPPASEAGDEPKFLKSKIPDCHVIVGKSRAYTGYLAQILGSDIVLLDDGLQHHPLHRDAEIITLDVQNPLGGGRFLPYGYLREGPKILSKADLLVLDGVRDENHYAGLVGQLRKWTLSPVVSMKKTFSNGGDLKGKKVSAFCAIARPARFFNSLKNLGCQLVCTTSKPDHEPFSQKELDQVAEKGLAEGAECLVWTEKDAIKWSTPPKLPLPLVPLCMEVEPQFGAEHLHSLIHGVQV